MTTDAEYLLILRVHDGNWNSCMGRCMIDDAPWRETDLSTTAPRQAMLCTIILISPLIIYNPSSSFITDYSTIVLNYRA